MKILIVEDDSSLSEALAAALSDQLYVVDVVANAEDAWLQSKTFNYDLILLDVMLPMLDGISFSKQLRTHGNATPILMLTARDGITNKVAGLDAGADDYLIKPVDLAELLARIRALLRRGSVNLLPILEWGKLRLNPITHELTYNNFPVNLTAKEFSLVELFMRQPLRVFTHRFILENLWQSEEPPGENTIKVHIKSIRDKFKKVLAPSDLIETIYGVGYRLNPLAEKN
ncbi:two component transcriptional regulator, winged helix family [Crinalium epipsammum PCC 9333]|uniref:Two component transcriptional regulator, winged helix family n=1 Tax=Crinalium epipsammum PCC 9333 TaxID=1173022 RepID=K9W458_9CYAN|nr:response regulator transcription factor [Crinalium epipsammum]AFZ14996.1 two component transcriptional regulator, winged helix family [Crinalium epipsammum PCC 9333]